MKSLVVLTLLVPAAVPSAFWLVRGEPAGVGSASPSSSAVRVRAPRPATFRVRFDALPETRGDARAASDVMEAGDADGGFAGGTFDGDAYVMLDDDRRFEPTAQPDNPEPQRPPLSTPENVDTGKPVHAWQRATDDWFTLRPKLEDKGIAFNANLTAEYAKNLRGGANTAGWGFGHLLNANLTLDTERLLGFPGGTAFVNFQQQNGQPGLDVGDAQGTSNIDADGRTQMSEAWYEQSLLGGKFRVKAGKIDANTEFAFVENGAEFINSSMGFSPTILGLTTFPDPSFGVLAFAYPCDRFYAGAGVFDGAAQESVPTGSRGPKTLFGDPADLFLIGEAGTTWTAPGHRAGRLGLGVWHHTGTFDRFDAMGTENGTTGFYAVFDQFLWRESPNDADDAQGLGLYAQYGYADADVSEIEHHVGLGVAWTGALPTRDDDVVGLGVSYVRFTDDAGAGLGHDEETAVELFYKLQLTPWVSVKPDLQYVRHPGGVDGQDDALVATVRAVIDF